MIGSKNAKEINREHETTNSRYKKKFKELVLIWSVATIIACVDSLSAPRREFKQFS